MMTKSERIQLFKDVLRNICDADFGKRLLEEGYFDAPAGMKHHGAYEGGLFDHSFEVARQLQELTAKLDLKWERPEGPYVVGLLHDLCKVKQYKKVEDKIVEMAPDGTTIEKIVGYRYEWEKKQDLPGHGAASLLRLMEWGGPQLKSDELYCIRYHMGAYAGSEEWPYLDAAIRKCPNIIYAHAADMIASKIVGI